MRARALLPVLLFLAAAGGTALLGSRILSAERVSAERTARERLRARARAAAASLEAEASRLLREAALGEPDAIREGDRFLKPEEPRTLGRLEVPRARDPEGAFYLDQGERAEAADGEPDRAAGLYGAAAAEGRDPGTRAVALYRLAALERRRGREEEARALEGRFLAALPSESLQMLEALVVRARVRPPDGDLRRDVLLRMGEADEGFLLGLLRDAGQLDPAAVESRREQLRLMASLRDGGGKILPAQERTRTSGTPEPQGVVLRDGWILARARAPDGTDRYRVGPVPALPEGVRLESPFWTRESRNPSPESPRLEETVAVGGPFRPWSATASEPLDRIEAEARSGAAMLGGALFALLGAGATALVLAVRAARRETEAARARADFVTRVGHDLRTPLAKIRMYAETVAAGRTRDPAEAREFATVAVREAEALTGMVERVLDFSRTTAAPEQPPRAPLDLAALAAEVADWHRPLLEKGGIRLDVRAAGPLPVLGDATSLRDAVSNLLENASRHGAAGESVEVEAARSGTMAEVRVRDRGPGIPAGMEERIFERFVRGPGAPGSGAGLGLALVRDAAEAHGGKVAASNREGGGAEFVLAVPLREEGA